MQAPPINPSFSPEPYVNPPVKKLRAGGTPPQQQGTSTTTAPPPPPTTTMPFGSSSLGPPPSGSSNSNSSFTARVDDAMSSRRAELLRLRQKTALQRAGGVGAATPPLGTAVGGVAPPPQPSQPPSAGSLLERARAQLPPPKTSGPSPLGPPPPSQRPLPPPSMPAPENVHYRRTSDIFPEVTAKVDAPVLPKSVPPPTGRPGPPTHPPPPSAPTPYPSQPYTPGPTPIVVRNLDSSFGALDVDSGPPKNAPTVPSPSSSSSASGLPPPSTSRAKSAPPQRPPPPRGPASPPKDPPPAARRPPPPGRPKPESTAVPLNAVPKGPPPMGPPPSPSESIAHTGTQAPPPAVGTRPAQPSKPPPPSSIRPPSASVLVPNGDTPLDKSSSHAAGSTGSQRSKDGSAPTPPTSPPPAAATAAVGSAPAAGPPKGPPPPQPHPTPAAATAPPPPSGPPLHHPTPAAASSGWAAPPFSPGGGGAARPTLQQSQQKMLPLSSSHLAPYGPPHLANESDDGALTENHHQQRALLSGAETPPMHNLSAELRLQSELAQVQRDKSEALRRVVDLEERLAEAFKEAARQQQFENSGNGPENGGHGEGQRESVAGWDLLQEAVRVAERHGEQEALEWARQHWPQGSDGVGSAAQAALPAPPRPSPLPRPRRPVDASSLPPECVQAAAERVEHEYEAECATFVVRRPLGLASERELWFQAGQLPAKRYAAAAVVSQVESLEVVAIVRADQSLLAVYGPRSARHESNGQWHDFGGALEQGEPLGYVSVVDAEGSEVQYSLDEVYEGAVAVREHYCLSILSTAAGLRSAAKGLSETAAPASGNPAETHEQGVGTEELAATEPIKEPRAAPPQHTDAPPDASGQFFGLLVGGLWFLISQSVSIVVRVVVSTGVSALCVVLLSVFWVYMANGNNGVPTNNHFNRPGIM